jgi:hypothetical protein
VRRRPRSAHARLAGSAVFSLPIALLATVATSPARAADAAPPLAGTVTFDVEGASPRVLDLAALAGAEDIHDRRYTVRDASGRSAVVTVSGLSLEALLRAAGIDPYSFTYVEVERPGGGGAVVLAREQATGARPFPAGPPIVYAGVDGARFLRPSAGSGDVNAGDSFALSGGNLTIALHGGQLLTLRATAAPRQAKPRQPVTFNAIVDRAGAGAALAYAWVFGDGTPAQRTTSPQVVHRYARRGAYRALVTVTTRDDPGGASAVVAVQIGRPLSGPNRQGGGTNPDRNAPDSGAADGTRPAGGAAGGADPDASAPDSGAADGARSPGSADGGINAATHPASAPPRRTAPDRPRQRVRGPATSAPPRRVETSRRTSKPRRTRTETAEDDRAVAISGRLLDGPAILASTSEPLAALAGTTAPVAARTGRLTDDAAHRFRIPAAVWQLAAIAALLLIGWLLEGRRPLPDWR